MSEGTIYPPNTKDWKPGDIVIHDADAKERRMLMRVTDVLPDGAILSRYISPGKGNGKKLWLNDKKYLHDPSLFPKLQGTCAMSATREFAEALVGYERLIIDGKGSKRSGYKVVIEIPFGDAENRDVCLSSLRQLASKKEVTQ